MAKNLGKKLRKTTNNKIYVWLFIFIGIVVIFFLLHKTKGFIETFDNQEDVPTLPRPFVNLYDDKGKKINVICISHPFTRNTGTNGSYEQYEEWKKKGIHFIGISSYSEFPGLVSNPFDVLSDKNLDAWKKYNYMELCEAWLHCFRNPDKYIDTTIPKALISESDFVNEAFKPEPSVAKEYDFIYVCLKDNDKCEAGWQSYIRNWELAKKCLTIMCEQFQLKGLLIGRINCEIPTKCRDNMTMKDFMPHNEFIKQYNKCKFAFIPNIIDASPRVLAEALCFDLPCLVNYNILGGWKYITKETGEFFTDENDFSKSLKLLLDNIDKKTYSPNQYYRSHYGKSKTGVELRDFLCNHITNLNFSKNSTKYINMGN
tara:strand:- start:268 stop:1383 length:1116 start_codon:yes stop_codon:yes gene_type:complete